MFCRLTDYRGPSPSVLYSVYIPKVKVTFNSMTVLFSSDIHVLHVYIQSDTVPGPLPLGVAVIDSSVKLFGLVFPRVANKHRLQMLEHFTDCIKSAKSSRQQAVQINIFTAVLCGLKVSHNNSLCSPLEI